MNLRNEWADDISGITLYLEHDDMLEVLKCVLGNAVRVSPLNSRIQVRLSMVSDAGPDNHTVAITPRPSSVSRISTASI